MILKYQELTRFEMEQIDRENTIVLVPLGALEQHGNQAPLGTDTLIATTMCDYIEKELKAEDINLLLFPVGLSTEHKEFCSSITFKPMTYYHMLYDICESLAHHGFKKMAFLVCHGGNAPVANLISREVRSDFKVYPFVLNSGIFDHPAVKATFSKGNTFDFHSGEMETSMVMAIDESLVKLETSEKGIPKNTAMKAHLSWLASDWVTEQQKPFGIGGDPKGATKEKGEIILSISAKEIAKQLIAIRDFKE